MLDEQLSRDIDKTLMQANIHKPRQCSLPTPTPVLPTTSLPPPQPKLFPATPPELPYLNFGGLDLMNDSSQRLLDQSTNNLPSTPVTPIWPSWCPELPSLVNNNIKWSEFPLFFDLSKLPDPAALPKSESNSQALQLWRPQRSPQPKKQSRFFPPSKLPRPSGTTNACKLHAADEGIKDARKAVTTTVQKEVKMVNNTTQTGSDANNAKEPGASASKLWRILNTPEMVCRGDDNGLYKDAFTYYPTDEIVSTPCGEYEYHPAAVGTPVELDDTEIPYVHANSLTGLANGRGSEQWPTMEDDMILFESPPGASPTQELPTGINELVVDPYTEEGYADALLAILDLPALPPSPNLDDSAPLTTDPMSAKCCNVGDAEMAEAGAHFLEEMDLFQLPPPAFEAVDEDIVDVAMLVITNHSSSCWCSDCQEPPELIPIDTMTVDDDWVVYSSVDEAKAPSSYSTWEREWGTVIRDNEKDKTSPGLLKRPAWDDVFPCTPSSVAPRAW